MSLFSEMPDLIRFLLRIMLACICGGAIGFERTKRLKEAGVRTHCIIAATAALMMLVSKYGFSDLALPDGSLFAGTRGADAARIAAQVVTGVSFLGAGVIFRNGNSVRGLTTASGIWATSGVGMAIGSGMLLPGLILTAVVVLIQLVFHRINIGSDVYSENDICITAKASPEFRDKFLGMADQKQIQIISFRARKNETGEDEYRSVFRPKYDLTLREMLQWFDEIPDAVEISLNK